MIESFDDFRLRCFRELIEIACKRFESSVLPLYSMQGNRKVEFAGSCILVKHRGLHLIITASHVADLMKHWELRLGSEFLPLPTRALQSEHLSGHRENDKVDLAAIMVPAIQVEKMHRYRFLEQQDFETSVVRFDNQLFCLGFPRSKNKRAPFGKAGRPPEQAIFCGAWINAIADTEKSLSLKLGAYGLNNLIMTYDPEATLQKVSVNGFSGGAVINIGNTERQMVQSTKMRSKICGVIIEFHEKTKSVIITKASILFRFLDSVDLDQLNSG